MRSLDQEHLIILFFGRFLIPTAIGIIGIGIGLAGVFEFRKDHHQVPHSPQGIFQILA